MGYDIDAHVHNWRKGAEDDLDFAQFAFDHGRPRYALFYAHLSLEKVLKGLVCKVTQNDPPKIHDLIRLAGFANLNLKSDQKEFLDMMTGWHLAGRYSELIPELPTPDEIIEILENTRKTFQWLNEQYWIPSSNTWRL